MLCSIQNTMAKPAAIRIFSEIHICANAYIILGGFGKASPAIIMMVLNRSAKHYTINLNGHMDTVSTDRLKPAHLDSHTLSLNPHTPSSTPCTLCPPSHALSVIVCIVSSLLTLQRQSKFSPQRKECNDVTLERRKWKVGGRGDPCDLIQPHQALAAPATGATKPHGNQPLQFLLNFPECYLSGDRLHAQPYTIMCQWEMPKTCLPKR